VNFAGGKWREDPVVEKLTIWGIFGVVVSLLPFAFGLLQSVGSKGPFSYSQILGGGQLLLVAVALSAGAFGDLIVVDVPPIQRMPKVFAIGSCVIEILVSSYWFGIITESASVGTPRNPTVVSILSAPVFIWALLSSGSCVLIATRCRDIAKDRVADSKVLPIIPDVTLQSEEQLSGEQLSGEQLSEEQE
jgi:hypothetical protein